MKFSFIIPMKNAEQTITQCLSAINLEALYDDEVIVISNNCTDQSIQLIEKNFNNIEIVICPAGTIGTIRNTGALRATGDVLCFIDSDCVIEQGWRSFVTKTLSEDSITGTGAKVAIPANAAWIEQVWYSQASTRISPVKYLNSGNFVIRKEAFDEMKGFSEELVTGEDSELGWRLCKAGYLLINNPNIKTIHLGNPKNIADFYNKEVWHALGMLGTFRVSIFDKPLLMTILYLGASLSSLIIILKCALNGFNMIRIVSVILLSILVPLITTSYRALVFSSSRHMVPQLFFLYCIYFMARSQAVITMCLSKQTRQWPTKSRRVSS